MGVGGDESRILVAPAPNWFCTSALALEGNRGIYVYSTKNSLILATILENRILGSIYCGIKSKPIGVSIFTTSSSSAPALMLASTHLDNKVRFWEIAGDKTDQNIVVSDICGFSSEGSSGPGGGERSVLVRQEELRVVLLTDTTKCSGPANVICFESGQVYVGDVQGEILRVPVDGLRTGGRSESLARRFHPVKEEVTMIRGLADGESLAVGYKSGLIIIVSHQSGVVRLMLEEDAVLRGAGILSIVDSSSGIMISTSRGESCVYRYSKLTETIERVRILGLPEHSTARSSHKTRGGSSWTLLAGGGRQTSSGAGRLYVTAEGGISEFEQLEDGSLRFERRFSISGLGSEKSREHGHGEIIFSVLTYVHDSKSYLLGITRSKRIFLFNAAEWRLEWIMNTLGGWVEELVSPSGFSHIIYVLSGEGRLMGVDLLEDQGEFAHRALRSYVYENLRGFGRDERIARMSASPVSPEYIFYSTNLGSLGVLYINPDNIGHYSNVRIRLGVGGGVSDSETCFLGRCFGCQKSEMAEFLTDSDLDWLVLQRPQESSSPSALPGDLKILMSGSQKSDNSAGSRRNDQKKAFNSQAKLFSSLIFNENRYPIPIIYNRKRVECIYLDLVPGLEGGELVLKTMPRGFGIQTAYGVGAEERHVVRLRTREGGVVGLESSDGLYLVSSGGRIGLRHLGGLERRGSMSGAEESGQEASICIYRVGFSAIGECRLGLSCSMITELENALSFGPGDKRGASSSERVLCGLVVFKAFRGLEEVYVLATSFGSVLIVVASSEKRLHRLENVFGEKSRMSYDYFSLSMIEVSGGSEAGDSERPAFAFNLAISNEFNQTSIVGVRVGGDQGGGDFWAEVLLVRPNTHHMGGITSKYHFRSKSIWFRDSRDFDHHFESNLRLLHGGQEQMLQLFNISRELMTRRSHTAVNRSSLIFLTNKNIYQQSNHVSMKVLTLLLEIKLGRVLHGVQSFGCSESTRGEDGEMIFDLLLFLNDEQSSSDLIRLHLETHSRSLKQSVKGEDKARDLSVSATGLSSSGDGKTRAGSVDQLVEYLYFINGQIDANSGILQSFMERHSRHVHSKTKETQANDTVDKLERLIETMKNAECDNLLAEWVRYQLSFDSTTGRLEDFETDCTVRTLIMAKLDDLETELKHQNSTDGTRVGSTTGRNPNILHEFCVLSVLQGRSHKAVEMYCHHNLYQCAWLISNLYLGHDHEVTLKVLRDWSASLASSNFKMQSFKCLVASSDFERLYDVLQERIHDLSDSHFRTGPSSRRNLSTEESLSQLEQLFGSLKLVGYYLLVSCSESQHGEDGRSRFLSKFSAGVADYMVLVFSRYWVEKISGDKDGSWDESGFEEVISRIKSCVVEEDNEKTDETSLLCFDMARRIARNIRLYEILVEFASLVISRGSRIEMSEVRRFLESCGVRSQEEVFLLSKKYTYLPFVDQVRLSREAGMMRDLLTLALGLLLDEADLEELVSRAREMIGVLFGDVVSSEPGSLSRVSIFDVAFEALFDIFVRETDLEILADPQLARGSDKVSGELNGDRQQLKGGEELEGTKRKVVAVKYDLYILSIIKRMRKASVLDSAANPGKPPLASRDKDSVLARPLKPSDLEVLEAFVGGEDEVQRSPAGRHSVWEHLVSSTSNDGSSPMAWLYNQLTSLGGRGGSQDLGLKAKELAKVIKKQYLKRKDGKAGF